MLASAIGVCAGVTGLPFYSLGLFIKPLSAEFGWGRAAASSAALCLQFGIVLSAPFIGRSIDRIGVRRVALTSLAGLALGFVLLSRLGPSFPLFLCAWLGLSLLGSGTTPIAWTRSVATRFDKGRGIALGLTLVGTGVAGFLAPWLIGGVVASHGWRNGCLVLAAAIGLLALPGVAFLMRDTGALSTAVAEARRRGPHVGQALRSRRFAQIGIAFFLIGIVVAGMIVHLVPLLQDRGLAPGEAARDAAMMGFAVIVGRLVVGWLCDRVHAPYVAFVFLMLPVASCLILLAHGPAIPAVLLLGLAAGAEIDLLAYLVSRYFGLRAYGEVYGWLLSIFSLGAGLGPVLIGWSFDRAGSYAPMLVAASCIISLGAVLVATLGPFPASDEQGWRKPSPN
ncbi:MFS transporter [Sphingomonas chungangi]|uniref:MFS transporter n=1 Tax=Sphingomonas chungangi TaxID=2683589 RepID=UPI0031B637CE